MLAAHPGREHIGLVPPKPPPARAKPLSERGGQIHKPNVGPDTRARNASLIVCSRPVIAVEM
jgi:hypothetical protein